MKEKFCAYCRTWQHPEGFKLVLHLASNTRRSQCPGCQDMRKKSRAELSALAQRDKEERKSK